MANFFDLPGEIRNQIYAELITPTASATATKPIPLKHCVLHAHLTPKTAAATIHAQFAGLSQANQQLRHEFWPLLWSSLSYELCDCHSHTLDDLEHLQVAHLRTASATGHVFLPPMVTGPRALGCGRVAKLVYGGVNLTYHPMAVWFRSPVELAGQLAAVLAKLEFRGELRVGCALPHHIKLLGELVGRLEARMRDPGVASFKKAVGGLYGDWEFLWMCVVEDAAWGVEHRRRRGLVSQWGWREEMAQMVEGVVGVDFAGLAEEERFRGLVVPDVRDGGDRTFNGSYGWLLNSLRLY